METTGSNPARTEVFENIALGDERAEREERRGLEARGGALLAAGVGVIGLLGTALALVKVGGAQRDGILGVFALGTGVMLLSLVGVADALAPNLLRNKDGGTRNRLARVLLALAHGNHQADTSGEILRQRNQETRSQYAAKLRRSNERIVAALRGATWRFAAALSLLLAALLWAAWASNPNRETVQVVVRTVNGESGKPGPEGPEGKQGKEGRLGPEGKRGKEGKQGPPGEVVLPGS